MTCKITDNVRSNRTIQCNCEFHDTDIFGSELENNPKSVILWDRIGYYMNFVGKMSIAWLTKRKNRKIAIVIHSNADQSNIISNME